MKRKHMGFLAGLLTVSLFLGGCTSLSEAENQTMEQKSGEHQIMEQTKQKDGAGNNPVMGRYMEQQISVDENLYNLVSLLKTQEGLKIISSMPAEYLLKDGGSEAEQISFSAYPEAFRKLVEDEAYFFSLAAAENGAKIFSLFEMTDDGEYSYPKYLLLPDGTLQEWNEVADEKVSANFWYGKDGFFYAGLEEAGYKIYRTNAETGETEFLTECTERVQRIFSNGTYLFLQQKDALLIFDLENKTMLDEDPVLLELVQKELIKSNGGNASGVVIGAGDSPESIYVATEAGLYRHVLYGSVMEQVIDGSLCSLSDITKYFTDMYADVSGGMAVFYFLYDNGKLCRFSFDETVPSVPDTTVRVYSLHEDNNIRLAISAYQTTHPEVYVQYEIGVDEEMGETADDALKNLATQLAGGTGPDVFVMEGLPYDSYVEKGILADLGGIVSEMAPGELWENIVNGFRKEEALYAVPMAFRIPVIVGEEQSIQKVNGLSDLADLLEQGEVQEGKSMLGLLLPEKTIYAMGLAAGNAWMKDGALDKEAVAEFLKQCKRIYEADRKGLTEEQAQELILHFSDYAFGSDNAIRNMQISRSLEAETQLVMGPVFNGYPYCTGLFGGDIKSSLNVFLAWLDYAGMSYQLLPGGQSGAGKSCIVETLLGINGQSPVLDYAKDFVKFAMSEDFQKEAMLSGIPMNRKAFYAKEENTLVDENGDPITGAYSGYAISGDNGETINIEIYWASEEQIAKYNQMVESIDTVNHCDDRVFNAVIEEGVHALDGTKGIEETVEAIEKKVQLYLAE